MIDCRFVQRELQDFFEGDLPEPKAEAVRAHLADCPSCARELDTLVETVALVSSLPELEPPPAFAAAVASRIAGREAAAARLGARLLFPALRGLALAGGGSAALSVVLFAIPATRSLVISGFTLLLARLFQAVTAAAEFLSLLTGLNAGTLSALGSAGSTLGHALLPAILLVLLMNSLLFAGGLALWRRVLPQAGPPSVALGGR